jgi:hypothetical protein
MFPSLWQFCELLKFIFFDSEDDGRTSCACKHDRCLRLAFLWRMWTRVGNFADLQLSKLSRSEAPFISQEAWISLQYIYRFNFYTTGVRNLLFASQLEIAIRCQYLILWRRVVGWLRNNERKRSWPNLRYYPDIFLKGLRKTTKNFVQYSRSLRNASQKRWNNFLGVI